MKKVPADGFLAHLEGDEGESDIGWVVDSIILEEWISSCRCRLEISETPTYATQYA